MVMRIIGSIFCREAYGKDKNAVYSRLADSRNAAVINEIIAVIAAKAGFEQKENRKITACDHNEKREII